MKGEISVNLHGKFQGVKICAKVVQKLCKSCVKLQGRIFSPQEVENSKHSNG